MGKTARPRKRTGDDVPAGAGPQIEEPAAPRTYSFHCYGHENIRAKHDSTIEFTREAALTRQGTCIIGVRADFDPAELRRLTGKVKITVEVGGLADKFYAWINPDFHDEEEIVFRRSRFNSPRTLGFRLNKGAAALRRDIVLLLKDPQAVMRVTLEEMPKKRKRLLQRRDAESAEDAEGFYSQNSVLCASALKRTREVQR